MDDAFLCRPTEEYAERAREVHDLLQRANLLLPTPLCPEDDPIAFAEKVRLFEEDSALRRAEVRRLMEERNKNLGLPPPKFYD